ncbi:hypothetical protein BGX30_008596 [Mortierella sp. GBA39]|nr:hypothetical protein BGX30_008596 [Mortierella sp. GBA39]
MKDPKTVKRKKHSRDADSLSNEAHRAESKSSSIVSRMKKALYGSGFSTNIKITLSHCDSSGFAELRTEFDLNEARIAINEVRIAINKVRICFNKSRNAFDETKCGFREDDTDVN